MQEHDLALARKGDPAAFERLVTPYLNGLYGFLVKRMGSLAEDIDQETLLGAWHNIKGFAGDASIKTWLYAIAGYRCADALRKKAREPLQTQLDERLCDSGFESDTTRALDIRDSLRTLDPEDQSLLYLVYTQGFTQRQAAGVLGIPEGTVKSRLSRLRTTLKSRLGGEQHDT